MTIGAVDISSTTVAGQVNDTSGKTGRTFVFIPIDMSTTSVISIISIILARWCSGLSSWQYGSICFLGPYELNLFLVPTHSTIGHATIPLASIVEIRLCTKFAILPLMIIAIAALTMGSRMSSYRVVCSVPTSIRSGMLSFHWEIDYRNLSEFIGGFSDNFR